MIVIRKETDADRASIRAVTEAAFRGRPYAGGDEQDVIDALRRYGALTISLVALDGAEIIGQITFSPAAISSGVGSWYALGPVSVVPDRQGEGVGGHLIEAGIRELAELGAWGCILTGNPGYYARHGFQPAGQFCPDVEPAEYFMLRLLGEKKPTGRFAFHEAFYLNAGPGADC